MAVKDKYSVMVHRLKAVLLLFAVCSLSMIFLTFKGKALQSDRSSEGLAVDFRQSHQISALNLKTELVGQGFLDVKADQMLLDESNQNVFLNGNVNVALDTGWDLRGDELQAKTDGSEIISHTNVKLSGMNLGEVTAGSLRARRIGGTKESYIVNFQDGVKLVYSSQKK